MSYMYDQMTSCGPAYDTGVHIELKTLMTSYETMIFDLVIGSRKIYW